MENIKTNCESLIRAGNLAEARALLLSLRSDKLPRESLADFADLARRTELFNQGLKLLFRIVRSDSRSRQAPTVRERIVYGSILTKLGLAEEALDIFTALDERPPEALLYQSFAHFSRWDYSLATPLLKEYVSTEGLTPYQKVSGKLNLAAALTFLGRFDESRDLLSSVIAESGPNSWNLFLRGGHELSGISAVFEERWEAAEAHLHEVQKLSGQSALGRLFSRKWLAIMDLRRHGVSARCLENFRELRALAADLDHPETLRDLDFYLALQQQDPENFARVYFGTPHESFRRRMREQSSGWMTLPSHYVLDGSSSGARSNVSLRVFDLDKGCEVGSDDNELEPGKAQHRFLRTLASDTYRGFSVCSLFGKIFPGEYYNPDSSPRRVHAVALRLRRWISEHQAPVDVRSVRGTFHLTRSGSYGFLVRDIALEPSGREELALNATILRLKDLWPEGTFSSSQAARKLGVSIRTMQVLIKQALDDQALTRRGHGRAIQYSFRKAA